MSNTFKFNKHKNLFYSGLIQDSDIVFLTHNINSIQDNIVILAKNHLEAKKYYISFKSLVSKDVIYLENIGILPYESFSANRNTATRRVEALYDIQDSNQLIIISIEDLFQKFPPKDYIKSCNISLATGNKIDITNLSQSLVSYGYEKVTKVKTEGEFSIKGSVLDIFLLNSKIPYRVDIFDDIIENIYSFDIFTNKNIDKLDRVKIFSPFNPATQKENKDLFVKNFKDKFQVRKESDFILNKIDKIGSSINIDNYLPLFFEENYLQSIFSYLNEDSIFVINFELNEALKFYFDVINQRFNSNLDPLTPAVEPKELYFGTNYIENTIAKYRKVFINQISAKSIELEYKNLPSLNSLNKPKYDIKTLKEFLNFFKGKVVFIVNSLGRLSILEESLASLNLNIFKLDSIESIKNPYNIFIANFTNGFIDKNIAYITEFDLLGELAQKVLKSKTGINKGAEIHSFYDLTEGDLVIHEDYGVGRFLNIETIDSNSEFIVLEYAQGNKLYIPFLSINSISKYKDGLDSSSIKLNFLGKGSWDKNKKASFKKIYDTAVEIIELSAKRELIKGFEFKLLKDEYKKFVDSFLYEETFDQKNAIDDVLADMQSSKIMDRLLCGDVGFGKTEVALRASFLAVKNNKQVVILAPTTLLAQQHYEVFSERFSSFGIKVSILSRFQTPKEQRNTLDSIESGELNILIATHKVLSSNINFFDLGLLIVDEEHRFGVRQKEKIKLLAPNVDVLYMTATPIPRTLNIALSGIKDISMIYTPPSNRLSIKTIVHEYSQDLLKEAVLRELGRGGQVYYLHNDVKTINTCARRVREVFPEARVIIAHGQMSSNDLEIIMRDFYYHKYDILICSTIIETGIDIPNTNTIIIDRADKLGLAQMHQIRGRVGRSRLQGYAYLFIPTKDLITSKAKKRLNIFSSIDSLGAGYSLSAYDLEFRGSGSIFGDEQSGQIDTLGASMYTEVLNKAIESLKVNSSVSFDDIFSKDLELKTDLNLYIPSDYIYDINIRLNYYKKITKAESISDLFSIKSELIDNYGYFDEPLLNLFFFVKLKINLKPFKITQIILNSKGGSIEFSKNANLDPQNFITKIMENSEIYSFKSENIFAFKLNLAQNEKVSFFERLCMDLFNLK